MQALLAVLSSLSLSFDSPWAFRHAWLLTREALRAGAVTKNLDPSPEQIQEVQEEVLAALVALFDQHKHLMPGWEYKILEIA